MLHTLEGEQRLAALDQINKLLSSKGNRDALLAIKATTQMQLGEIETAEATVATFLESNSDNPIALGQSALIEISKGNLSAAIDHLQSALQRVSDSMPLAVYEAIGVVAQAMLAQGDVLGARCHLVLQASIGGVDDTSAASTLLKTSWLAAGSVAFEARYHVSVA